MCIERAPEMGAGFLALVFGNVVLHCAVDLLWKSVKPG